MKLGFRSFVVFFLLVFLSFIIVGIYKLISGDAETFRSYDGEPGIDGGYVDDQAIKDHPIIVWWTPFTGEQGALRTCGKHRCFFTQNRNYHYQHHPQVRAFMFYGSDLKPDDVPLPRRPHHEWALLHEEAPKNNYALCHEEALSLFNHTATFRQRSDFPLTLLHLESLAHLTDGRRALPVVQKNRAAAVAGLAAIAYVQSDCDAPSGRDAFVRELMRHVAVDSYGKCQHNRDLPKHLEDPVAGMFHPDFYDLLASYKFVLAMENSVCDDYITEKLWRPLHLGVVPIYYGAPNVKEWLPDNRSAILVSDFRDASVLAEYVTLLNANDDEYDRYLAFKRRGDGVVDNAKLAAAMRARRWGVRDEDSASPRGNFVEHFECHVCERLHEGAPAWRVASAEHYGCPRPGRLVPDADASDTMWQSMYDQSRVEARAWRRLVERNVVYSSQEYYDLVSDMLSRHRRR